MHSAFTLVVLRICTPLITHLHARDIVVEDRGGDLACVEVKAAATVAPQDYRAMEKLRAARGDHFKAGIVLYTGAQTVPLGDRLWAVPISGLWSPGSI